MTLMHFLDTNYAPFNCHQYFSLYVGRGVGCLKTSGSSLSQDASDWDNITSKDRRIPQVVLPTDLILPYTDMCIALYTQCFPSVCEKNLTGDLGGIRTHNLLLNSADVLTSRP